MLKLFSSLIFILFLTFQLTAQKVLTLSQTIEMAGGQSVDAVVALNQLKTSYWEFRTYQADLLPEVNFSSTLPDYSRSYNLYQNEDGSYKFVRSNLLGMSGNLSVDQNIWFTGGKISLNSSLQFINPLNTYSSNKYYLSVPLGVTLTQPIFGTNSIKWKRKIEPLRYEEAKAVYLENEEGITVKAINYYFQLLTAQENLVIAEQNKESAKHIYEIADVRRKMGQISENELLQLKLSALKAGSNLTKQQSTLNASMFQLRSFLGLSEMDSIAPVVPEMVEYPPLKYEDVLSKALENNPLIQNIRRRKLEAEYEVAKAKGNQREINLYASVGYTGQEQQFQTAYRNLIDYLIVQLGVKIPLLDWGKRKGNVKVAESNRDVTYSKLKQEQMDFNQEIYLLVQQYNNQAEQVRIAKEADQIAQQRYKTSVESFMIGKINTLDLIDAQTSKDDARVKYISEMQWYWSYLYQIRSLTLYDFTKNKQLTTEFDELLNK